MNWRRLAEFAGFQAVWLVCAWGAARGTNAPGLAAAAMFIIAQIAMNRDVGNVCILALAAGAVGLIAESALASSGLLRYLAAWPNEHFAPAWIVGLWLAFGTTLPTIARLLPPSAAIKAAALGAVFAPLSYVAGAQLGALTLAAPRWLALSAVAIVWALAFPLLVSLCLRLQQR